MRFRKLLETASTLVTLTAVVVVCDGCKPRAGIHDGPASLRLRKRAVPSETGARRAYDHYVELRGRSRGPALVASRSQRELWPPFRVDVTEGLFDASSAARYDGVFSLELNALRDGSFEFVPMHSLRAVVEDGGLRVRAMRFDPPQGQSTQIEETLGDVFLPDTSVADLAIEHDGDTVHYLARVPGDEEFVEVATSPRSSRDLFFQPGVRASGISRSVGVGIDAFRVQANGEAPDGEPVPELHAALEATYVVGDDIVAAIEALDGGAPDADRALQDIDGALSAVTDAREAIALIELPAGPGDFRRLRPERALRGLRRVTRLLEEARDGLLHDRPAHRIERTLYAALDRDHRAAQQISFFR
jgi:hypothetical protein